MRIGCGRSENGMKLTRDRSVAQPSLLIRVSGSARSEG